MPLFRRIESFLSRVASCGNWGQVGNSSAYLLRHMSCQPWRCYMQGQDNKSYSEIRSPQRVKAAMSPKRVSFT